LTILRSVTHSRHAGLALFTGLLVCLVYLSSVDVTRALDQATAADGEDTGVQQASVSDRITSADGQDIEVQRVPASDEKRIFTDGNEVFEVNPPSVAQEPEARQEAATRYRCTWPGVLGYYVCWGGGYYYLVHCTTAPNGHVTCRWQRVWDY